MGRCGGHARRMKSWIGIVAFAVIALGLEAARHMYAAGADMAEVIGGIEIFAWIIVGGLLVRVVTRKKPA